MLSVNKKIGSTNVSFTPAFYKRAIKSYKQGYFRELTALIEQAETDSHVNGCLTGRKAGFKREWRITEFSESSADVAVKDFIQGMFLNLDMRKLFDFIHDARLKRFSVIGLDWEEEESKQVVTNFKKFNQKYFRYDPKTEELKIDWGNTLKEIPTDAALVCETDYLPIMIAVLRDYILKEFGLESWASFIETFGEAFIIGKYPPGASADFRTAVETAVNNIGIASRGIAPEGTNFEIIEAQRNTGDHEMFVARADKGISITLLGHENAVEGSKGLQVGENISSYKAKQEVSVDDIFYIEEQVTRLMRMIINRNFSINKYPVFTIDKSGPVNVIERIRVIESAYDRGYKIHPDEYAKLGLYKYEDQTDALEKDFNNPLEPF